MFPSSEIGNDFASINSKDGQPIVLKILLGSAVNMFTLLVSFPSSL